MRFTADDLDIPDSLINLHSRNELVIFVGAGVSAKAYPLQKKNTYYPTFKDLVLGIACRLGKTLSDKENRLLEQGFSDRILGEWQGSNENVHAIAAEILQENEKGQRIDLHRSIISLFSEELAPRIVTTNFDNLLRFALEQEGFISDPRWKIFEAPALPPANKNGFKGICFLHGCVGKPEDMILTDKDIGRAYMDEGWALRFAHSLFQNFNVLFIGYSLEDPPLRYLSLALEGKNKKEQDEKKHWALLPRPKNEKKRLNLERDWKRRGVEPIWFPAKRKDYRALERNFYRWSVIDRLGYIDRRNLLAESARSNPFRLKPYELDRVKHLLLVPELLRDFGKNDLHEDWFDKLVEWRHLDFLLINSGERRDADFNLADVLATWLIGNPQKWLIKLAPYRSTINFFLVDSLFSELERNSEIDHLNINTLRLLLEFFRPQLENITIPFRLKIGKILKKLIQNGLQEDAIWLYNTLIKTETVVSSMPNFSYLIAQKRREDVSGLFPERLEFNFVRGDLREYEWQRYLDKVFLPNIKSTGYPLLIALSNRFLDVRRTLKRVGKGDFTYIRRKAIEDHDRDKHSHGVVDFFIKALRIVWDTLLITEVEQAYKIFQYWRGIDDVVFKRLCLHAARKIFESGNAK